MEERLFVRVDDRFIHGQVAVKWVRHLRLREIWIVDDALAKDSFMQGVYGAAAPPGTQVHVVATQQAAGSIAIPASRASPALVLIRSPLVAVDLLQQGLPFSELNLGGLAAVPGATRLSKNVAVTPTQVEALCTLVDAGIRVYIQMVPEEHRIEFDPTVAKGKAVPMNALR